MKPVNTAANYVRIAPYSARYIHISTDTIEGPDQLCRLSDILSYIVSYILTGRRGAHGYESIYGSRVRRYMHAETPCRVQTPDTQPATKVKAEKRGATSFPEKGVHSLTTVEDIPLTWRGGWDHQHTLIDVRLTMCGRIQHHFTTLFPWPSHLTTRQLTTHVKHGYHNSVKWAVFTSRSGALYVFNKVSII